MLHVTEGRLTEKNRRNTVRLAIWTFAWVATMALAAFGPKFLWNEQTGPTAVVIVVNLLIGIGMIFANKRQLADLDELQQKIQLQAMGVSLGVGLVVGLSYSMLDITNLIAFDAEISHLVILMSLTYLAAAISGSRSYR